MRFLILILILFGFKAGACEEKPFNELNHYMVIKIKDTFFTYTKRECKDRNINKQPWYEIEARIFEILLDEAGLSLSGVYPSDPDYPIIVRDYLIRKIKKRLDMNPIERAWIDIKEYGFFN